MPKDRRTAPISDSFPRRVLIAPDKFKGTLTSGQAARAIERGLRRAWPQVETTRFLLTDGGEGFMEFMVRQTGGRFCRARTTDARGRTCRARWGVLGDGRTAVIGLTNASGIVQLPPPLRNPEETTNTGTGRLIELAMKKDFLEILIGLGGSATTDGGISLATALGYKFIDKDGLEIPLNGRGLFQLAHIIPPENYPKVRFTVGTDVNNPLFGPKGAAYQFARQKGGDSAMVARLDANLRRLAKIVKRDLGKDFAHEPGAGSAGGCGYGLMTFFGARRENGFQLVRRITKLDALIRRHDLVVTGEGCLDRTSMLGKAPLQLAELARRLKRPAWALCGRIDLPLARTPFDLVAALSTKDDAGPSRELLTTAQHARRLEQLAYEIAMTKVFK
jgi:glycerate kinase